VYQEMMAGKKYQKALIVLVAFLLVCTFLMPSNIVGINFVCENVKNREILTDWSEDVRLTDCVNWFENGYASCPTISVYNGCVYIIYENSWGTFPYYGYELGFLKSLDNGKSWTYKNFTNYDSHASSMPDVCVSGANIYVVWQDYRDSPGCPEIYFKYSNNSGQSWCNDTALTSNDGVPSQKPRIVVWNTTLHVVLEDCRDDPYKAAGEIYYMRSLDGGITWDDGQGNVNQTQRLTFSGIETSSGCCEPTDITVYGNTIHVVGTQIRPGNERSVVYLNSSDNGHTWSSDVTYLSPINDGYNSACGSLAVRNNTVYTAFSDDYYGIVYRKCNISNNMWTDIVSVHPGAMTDVQITADYDSERLFITFWSSSMSYYTVSYDNGYFWYGAYNLSDEQAYSPQLAVYDGYVHAVFVSDRTGNSEIYYKRSPEFNDPPEINSFYPETNVTITETQNQMFSVNASDPDNDTLTYLWYLNDTPLIDEINSLYTFIPENNFSGNYSVKVSVSDEEYGVNQTWIVTVINVKQLQETINNLQTQLENLNETYTNLLNTLTRLSENLSSIWSQLNNSEFNTTELQTELQGVNENLTALRNQLNLSNQNNTVLQNLINSLNQSLNISNEQITTLWNMFNQSLANETEFRNLITQLNQSINSLQEEIDKLKEENEQVIKEKEVAEERLMVAVILLIVVGLVCTWIMISKRKK